jgi:GR25 family glycosyltransferase involved in LPS biosynthesis
MTILSIINNYKVEYKFFDFTNKYSSTSIINKYVKSIYVINLKKNDIRRNYIIILMKKMNINFHLVVVDCISQDIFNALNINNSLTKGEIGCTLSHLWCLNQIIKNKDSNAIIFEDDIIFHKNFTNLFAKLYSPDIHFLMLGACDFSFSKNHKDKVCNNMYTINEFSSRVYGSHANYYSLIGAKTMFKYKSSNIDFFDKNYLTIFNKLKNASFICYPNLVVSDISTTDIDHIYPFFSIAEDNYYNKCFINFNFTDYYFIYLNLLLKNKNTRIDKNDNYKSYMNKIINNYFYNNNYSTKLKDRLVWDFFTIEDIKFIIQ